MEEFEDKSVEDVVAWLEDKGFDEGVQRAFRGNVHVLCIKIICV